MRRIDKEDAVANQIPQSLRRYAKRYGVSVEQVIKTRKLCGDGKRVGERSQPVTSSASAANT